MDADAYIARIVDGQEWEIPIYTNVEEVYRGSGAVDDPSYAAISEVAKVAADSGPFKTGDTIILDEDERRDLEEDELNYQRELVENPD